MLEAVIAPVVLAVAVLIAVGVALYRRARGRPPVDGRAARDDASARRARGEISSQEEYERRRRG